MNKQSGLAPLIIVIIIAVAAVGIIGGGVGGYRIVSKLKEAKQAYEVGQSREPAAEISRETGTEPSAAPEEKQIQKEAPAAETKTETKAKTSPAPRLTYKTFEFETAQQGTTVRFEAPSDWAWKDDVPPAASGGLVCRPQSRGNGCMIVWVGKGAGGMEKEANARYEERVKRDPNVVLQKTTFADRQVLLLKASYEITTGLDMAGYPTGDKIEKKLVTESYYFFTVPGFDFFVAANDGWAFADTAEFKDAFERLMKTFVFIDASKPAAPEPEPIERRPTLSLVPDEKWCVASGPTTSVNPLTGVENIFQGFGVESVQVGPITCRACRVKNIEKSTGYYIEMWKDLELWNYLNLPSKWGCMKAITVGESQSIYEKWSTETTPECVKQDGTYLSGNAGVCE